MSISVIKDGLVVAEIGPMYLRVVAARRGKPDTGAAWRGAQEAVKEFTALAQQKAMAIRSVVTYGKSGDYCAVLRRMIEACRATGDLSLTPMAAVAGALADIAADAAVEAGATRVLADNGGDVAIRLSSGESARIGVRSNLSKTRHDYVLHVGAATGVGGVATSGLGGRSLTKGVASAACVAAASGALADACATLVANSTAVSSPRVKQTLAESLRPDTDIRGHMVTERVDGLLPEEIEAALNGGVREARKLPGTGFFLAVQGVVRMDPPDFATPSRHQPRARNPV